MKLLKKRCNIIAILMFITFALMLVMDFTKNIQEKQRSCQELKLETSTQPLILAENE